MEAQYKDEALTLQYGLLKTPEIPIAHMAIPAIDDNCADTAHVKAVSTIYNGTCGGEERKVSDAAFKKAMKLLWNLQGGVSEEQIRENLTATSQPISAPVIAAAKRMITGFQNMDSSSSGEGWWAKWLEREVAFEDWLVLIFNCFRLSFILRQNRQGLDAATARINTEVGNYLYHQAVAAKGRMVEKLRTEINGVKDGTVKLIKFNERTTPLDAATEQKLQNKEVVRLDGLVTKVNAWSMSQWPQGAYQGNDVTRLGDSRMSIGKRTPRARTEFFLGFAQRSPYLMSAFRAGVDAFYFKKSLFHSPPFQYWKVQQFLHTCDTMLIELVIPRLINKRLQYILQPQHRLEIPQEQPNSPAQRDFFATLRGFYGTYNSNEAFRGAGPAPAVAHPPVSLHHMFTSVSDKMEGNRGRSTS